MNSSFITRYICVGPNPTTYDEMTELEALGITAILSLQSEEDRRDRDANREQSAAEAKGLTYHCVPVTDFDSLDLKRKLPACVIALHDLLNAGHRVYLHCTAGVSRSPTVAVAYLHWVLKWPLERALDELRVMRPGCSPLADVIRVAERPKVFGKQ
jgi:protein-tyrosine phosphatase